MGQGQGLSLPGNRAVSPLTTPSAATTYSSATWEQCGPFRGGRGAATHTVPWHAGVQTPTMRHHPLPGQPQHPNEPRPYRVVHPWTMLDGVPDTQGSPPPNTQGSS